MKPVILTRHALDKISFYSLAPAWMDRGAREPDWIAPDPEPPKERRFRAIPEHGGRLLRVVCVEEADHIRVVTVFPDRDARRPDAP